MVSKKKKLQAAIKFIGQTRLNAFTNNTELTSYVIKNKSSQWLLTKKARQKIFT